MAEDSRVRRGGCLAAVGMAGCAGDDEITHNPPGANTRVGPVLIRYAHIAEPPDGPWEPGDDAPFSLLLFNQGQRGDKLPWRRQRSGRRCGSHHCNRYRLPARRCGWAPHRWSGTCPVPVNSTCSAGTSAPSSTSTGRSDPGWS